MSNNFEALIRPNKTDLFTEGKTEEKVEGKTKKKKRKTKAQEETDLRSLADQAYALIEKSFNEFNRLDKEAGTDIARSTVLDYRMNLQKQQDNSIGIDALGIAAIATTYYALFTRFGTLNIVSSAYFDFNS